MPTVTISQLQKNISMLSSSTDSIWIQNGTTGEMIGTFIPHESKNRTGIMKYAGILKDRAHLGHGKSWQEIREEGKRAYFSGKSW